MRVTDKVIVAVAQAASVIMDREASAWKACELIRAAGEKGVQVLVFPEAFISGYPRGLSFDTVVGSRGQNGRIDWATYWHSAIAIPDETTRMIGEAVRQAEMYVVLGVIEQEEAGSHGTLYCTTLYYGPDGNILGKHRKLKPTGTERLIWGEGDGSTLTAIETPFGVLGGLICWENFMPQARLSMYGKGVNLYAAPTADARDTWQALLRTIACEGRCFVLAANQYVTRDMYPESLACYKDLNDQGPVMCSGGSAIVNPFGDYLAGPLYNTEGILDITLDLTQIEQGLFDFDVMGSYGRPDIFKLLVNEERHKPVVISTNQADFYALQDQVGSDKQLSR